MSCGLRLGEMDESGFSVYMLGSSINPSSFLIRVG